MAKYTLAEKISMEQLLSESGDFTVPQTGKLVDGIIIKKDKSQILVDIEGKMTWVISGKEIQDSLGTAKELEVGDKVSVMVLEDDSDDGSLILSIRKASQLTNWDRFKKFMKTGEVLTVHPIMANKGGLIVDVDGIKAFIPVSQLAPEHYPRVENSDSGRILTKLQSYIGQPFKVAVLNAEKETGKLIFSEKAARKVDYEAAIKNINVGDVVNGRVTGISKFGFFVTFKELEGLVHISEIAWGHVKNPSEFAKIGDEMDLKIIGTDNGKISLSLKRMQEDPWMAVASKYSVGQKIKGTVSKVSEFGAFVSLGEDINGLIHVSELDGTDDATTMFKSGDEVEATVIEIDPSEHRVALSMKEQK